MSAVVLYSYFRSSASFRVRMALHYKHIPFEYKAVHLLEDGGQQNSAQYQDINPSRQVPVLVHQDQMIAQSVAILEYLDESFPGPSLYPKEALDRALVRQFCEIINCTQPLQNLSTIQYLKREFSMTDEAQARWMNEWVGRGFHGMEAWLKKHAGQFCFGDDFSAADCFLAPQCFAAERFGIKVSDYATVSRVLKNLSSHPAYRAAHPTRQPDTPAELRANT